MAAKKTTTKTVRPARIIKNPLKRITRPKKASSSTRACFSCPVFKKVKKPILIIFLLIILGLTAAVYFFKNQFIVAIVNNRPISRLALVKELEKQGGKQTLEALITRSLILQEAKNQNVNISVDEINQEVEKIEQNLSQQGQKLDQLLEAQRMSKNDLMEEVRIQKIVEKLAGKDIEISDEEVNGYIEKNKDSFPQNMDTEGAKENIKQQLKQQKMSEKIQSWIESLHNKANIKYLLEF